MKLISEFAYAALSKIEYDNLSEKSREMREECMHKLKWGFYRHTKKLERPYNINFLRNVVQRSFENNSGTTSMTLTHRISDDTVNVEKPFGIKELEKARSDLWFIIKDKGYRC